MGNIVFVTAGSKDWGLGHLKRSSEIIDLLKQKGRKVNSVAFVPESSNDIYLESSLKFFDRIISSWDQMEGIETQHCIVDVPTVLQKDFFNFVKSTLKCPVIAIEWYLQKDNVIVESIDLRGGVENLKYAIIRREILAQVGKKGPGRKYDGVIMLGGRDQKKHAKKILGLFRQDKRFYAIKKALILGPMDNQNSEYFKLDTPGLDIYKNPQDLVQLMSGARVGLSNAGTSLMEFCALGVPTIVFPQSEEEESFSRTFFDKGCSVRGQLEGENFFNQLNALWSDSNLWAERSKKARLLIDGQGAQRIVNRIEDILDR